MATKKRTFTKKLATEAENVEEVEVKPNACTACGGSGLIHQGKVCSTCQGWGVRK